MTRPAPGIFVDKHPRSSTQFCFRIQIEPFGEFGLFFLDDEQRKSRLPRSSVRRCLHDPFAIWGLGLLFALQL